MRTSKIRASARYGAPENPEFRDCHPWTVTLRYQGRQMTVPFYMGPALCHEPTAREVLECLASDACGVENARSFEEWADDLGFDPDSRKAERTFRACERQTAKLRRLLGDAFDDAVYSPEEWADAHCEG